MVAARPLWRRRRTRRYTRTRRISGPDPARPRTHYNTNTSVLPSDTQAVNKTRVAVAGAGLIGLAHIAVAQKSPTCALIAIVDPAPSAEAAAKKAGVPLYKSLDELIAKDRPDGVILATPNQLHVPQALQCIEAHLPML